MKLTSVILLFAVSFAFQSCTVESQLAKEYIEQKDSLAILFIKPSYLFLTSLKEYEIENKKELSEYELDSALITNSLFLKNIDEERFINEFSSSYTDELLKLNFMVFTEEEMDTFLTMKHDNRYMLSLSQLEIEEYIMPIKDEEYINDVLYYKNVDLNAVNVNSWFDLTRLNTTSDEQQLLFASHYILDEYNSRFRYYPLSGDVSHTFEIDSITRQDIYDLGKYLGRKYAGYTYDYLLNMYIYNRLPENISPAVYYHYDRKSRRFYPVEDERFIPMED